jgi:hypothetical protein
MQICNCFWSPLEYIKKTIYIYIYIYIYIFFIGVKLFIRERILAE